MAVARLSVSRSWAFISRRVRVHNRPGWCVRRAGHAGPEVTEVGLASWKKNIFQDVLGKGRRRIGLANSAVLSRHAACATLHECMRCAYIRACVRWWPRWHVLQARPCARGMDDVSGYVRLGGEWPRCLPGVGGEARCWESPISGGSQEVRRQWRECERPQCGVALRSPRLVHHAFRRGGTRCSCSRDRLGEPRSTAP